MVKSLLVENAKNAAATFSICIKDHSKARTRDLGFKSAG